MGWIGVLLGEGLLQGFASFGVEAKHLVEGGQDLIELEFDVSSAASTAWAGLFGDLESHFRSCGAAVWDSPMVEAHMLSYAASSVAMGTISQVGVGRDAGDFGVAMRIAMGSFGWGGAGLIAIGGCCC